MNLVFKILSKTFNKSNIIILLLLSYLHTSGQENKISVEEFNETFELKLIGKKLQYYEDETKNLTIENVLSSEFRNKFKKWDKDIFVRPATPSAFWFKFSIKNNCEDDLWLEIASTYANYIDLYKEFESGKAIEIAKTGTMRPESTKIHKHNLFWLPINKAGQTDIETYYLRISASLPFELPLHVGTIKSLYKNRDKGILLTAGFIGLMLIMFLYNLFLYISTKDNVFIWYLGYLLLMGISMPYANSYPFIQKLEFWFIDKAWWNDYFLVWHGPVYLFVGMFCIKYLNLKEKLPIFYKLILIEIFVLSIFFPLLNAFGVKIVDMINIYQFIVLLLYLSSLISVYILLFKGNKFARFYALGWTFMIVHVFIFFATVNGILPFNPFTRNSLYFGVALEVWMFSLALGDKINIIRREKEQAQNDMIALARNQNETLEIRVTGKTAELHDAVEKIEEANSELTAQAEQLADSNQAKNKLFSIIGHDILSPIMMLKNFLEMTLDKDMTNQEFKKYAETFLSRVNSMLFMLKNLLSWANTQKEGFIQKIIKVNISKLVDNSIKLSIDRISKKRIEIVNNIPNNIAVECDINQVGIIIQNLLNNAIKFTSPEGEIIFESKEFNNSFYQFTIIDNGIGIKKENIQNVFLLNESSVGTKGEKGSGIGLLICKEFIAKNEGEIWVESELGKGSSFSFTLPKAKTP